MEQTPVDSFPVYTRNCKFPKKEGITMNTNIKTQIPDSALPLRPLNKDFFEKVVNNNKEIEPGDSYLKNINEIDNTSFDIPDNNTEPAEDQNPQFYTPAPRQWTVLTYFNGNCDLEDQMERKLSDLESVGSDDNIAFAAQIARKSRDGEAERVFLKQPGEREIVEELGPTNMAHAQNLKDFISWGMKEYPAENYMVILNGHGLGFTGILPDDVFKDMMELDEMEEALNVAKLETGNEISVLGLDSCLGANAETAYSAKDAAEYMVGSQELSFAANWKYKKMARGMQDKANDTSLTVEDAVRETINAQDNEWRVTSSVIDLKKMPGFAEKLDGFAGALLDTNTSKSVIKDILSGAQHYCTPEIKESGGNSQVDMRPMNQMRDVVSIANRIIRDERVQDSELTKSAGELSSYVKNELIFFESNVHGYGVNDSNGISLYTPTSEADFYSKAYGSLSIAKDTRWDEVIKKYGMDEFMSGIY
jgi:hypothetical protein